MVSGRERFFFLATLISSIATFMLWIDTLAVDMSVLESIRCKIQSFVVQDIPPRLDGII